MKTSAAPRGTTDKAPPVDGANVSAAYLRRYNINPEARLFMVKRDGIYRDVSWRESHERVLGIFEGLKKAGVKAGDRVVILSQTRAEWFQADHAIMALGAITVPIYHSSTQEDVGYILGHCEASLIFAEDEVQCRKVAEAQRTGGAKCAVVRFSGQPVQGLESVALGEFAHVPAGVDAHAEFAKSAQAIPGDAVASVVYTSGTTGQPKGAVLLHSCFCAELRGVVDQTGVLAGDVLLTFLPFAHIMGRVESLTPIFAGTTLAFAENVNSVAQNIGEVHPTLLVSVPRIYEKIYAKINSDVESGGEPKKTIFRWAVGVGRRIARLRASKQSPPLLLAVQYAIADRLVFSKVRTKMGGRIRFTLSGGAPLSPDLCEFFHACGIMVMEAYGLTETSAAIATNLPTDYEFGTVGRPVCNVEVRIATDGEILVRGPVVFREYYKDPAATSAVKGADGWFATGDIGEIDARGFLRITDRKKELIVTSGGKNIAPQKLENLLKTTRFVSNALVLGDRQKFLGALITLNEVEINRWAGTNGLAGKSLQDLAQHEKVIALVEKDIKAVNAKLASFETIKRFRLLAIDFTVESGELTPSMKLKRKVIGARYKHLIDDIFA